MKKSEIKSEKEATRLFARSMWRLVLLGLVAGAPRRLGSMPGSTPGARGARNSLVWKDLHGLEGLAFIFTARKAM